MTPRFPSQGSAGINIDGEGCVWVAGVAGCPLTLKGRDSAGEGFFLHTAVVKMT